MSEENKNIQDHKAINTVDRNLLEKEREIQELKRKLSEAQKVNKFRETDIRASLNSIGDIKKICIGVDEFGNRLWKKAVDLTDADIARRKEYIDKIKADNAKAN